MDTTKKELANGVATDSSRNVYVAGMTYGESEENSPSQSNTTPHDPSSGRSNQGLLIMIMAGIATDSSDNVYFAVETSSGLDGNSSAGGFDLFVVKYDSDGNKL